MPSSASDAARHIRSTGHATRIIRWRPIRVAVAVAVLAGATVLALAVAGRHATGDWLLRVVPVGPAPDAIMVDARTGRAFVTDPVEGSVRVLDSRSGTVLRTVGLGRVGPLALSEQTGRVFVAGSWNGPDKYGVYGDHALVNVLDARGGRVLRTIRLDVSDDAVAMIAGAAPRDGRRGARVYVVFPGAVAVLDGWSGTVVRRLRGGPMAPSPHLSALDARTGYLFLGDGAAGTVSVLDTRGRRGVRTVAMGMEPSALAVDARAGRVLVADGPAVRILDARSGAPLRTIAARPGSHAIAVDAPSGRAFLTNGGDGAITVLDTHSGAIACTIPASRADGTPVAVAVDGPAGRVFVAAQGPYSSGEPSGKGSVRVLDARTCAVLATIPVGDAVAVAVDARAGRAFVLNGDDRSVRPRDAWGWLPPWLRAHLPWLPHPPPPSKGGTGTVSIIDATR